MASNLNAGVIRRKDVVALSEEEWDLVLNVNLKAIYLLSSRVIPIMIKHGGGSVINTGSGWGLKGGPNAAAYCAAKGGTVNLTRAMAIDYGSQRHVQLGHRFGSGGRRRRAGMNNKVAGRRDEPFAGLSMGGAA